MKQALKKIGRELIRETDGRFVAGVIGLGALGTGGFTAFTLELENRDKFVQTYEDVSRKEQPDLYAKALEEYNFPIEVAGVGCLIGVLGMGYAGLSRGTPLVHLSKEGYILPF